MTKYYYAFIVLMLLISSCSNNNDTEQEDNDFSCGKIIKVTMQEEVDFLGKQGCTSINSLIIGDFDNINSSITDLSSLNSLTKVGSLIIANNSELTNLNGLQNITDVEILSIRENPALTSIEGLSSLTKAQGNIAIYDNDKLTSLSGLDNLEIVINGLDISNNDALINLDGLESFTQAFGGVRIANNDALLNINGLRNLKLIDEGVAPSQFTLPKDDDLSISDNDMLSDLCGITTIVEANDDTNVFGGITGRYFVGGNAYNPTQQDILNGDCSN